MWPSGISLPPLPWASLAVAASAGVVTAGRACSTCAAGAGAGGAAAGAAWREWRARRTDSSPSLISSSARFDFSSRSISALILRRSMQASSWDEKGVGGSKAGRNVVARAVRTRRLQAQGAFERVAVAFGAETADHRAGQVAEVAVLAERLAGMRVGQVDFDEGDLHRRQRIAHRHAGVGEGGRVDQDEVGAVAACGLDAFDQQVLGIALETAQRMPGFLGAGGQASIDLGQRGAAIDSRLAFAEQIEIGAMQDEELSHRCLPSGSGVLLRPAGFVQTIRAFYRKMTSV